MELGSQYAQLYALEDPLAQMAKYRVSVIVNDNSFKDLIPEELRLYRNDVIHLPVHMPYLVKVCANYYQSSVAEHYLLILRDTFILSHAYNGGNMILSHMYLFNNYLIFQPKPSTIY